MADLDLVANWRGLRAQTLWAVGTLQMGSAGQTPGDHQVAATLQLLPRHEKYAQSRVWQRALRAAIDDLRREGYLHEPARTTNAYAALSITPAAKAVIHSIERACLSTDLQLMTDQRGFGLLNRHVAIRVLHQVMVSGMPNKIVLPIDDEVAFKQILAVKIFQESVLAYEEAAALCRAVRDRMQGGIFFQYVAGEVRHTIDTSRVLLDNPECRLLEFLRLAHLVDPASPTVEPSDRDRQRWFRSQPSETRMTLEELLLYREYHESEFRTIGGAYLMKNKVVAQAMNKAKHGFVVPEDPGLLNPRQKASWKHVHMVTGREFTHNGAEPEIRYPLWEWPVQETRPEELNTVNRLYVFQAWLIDLLVALHEQGADLALFPLE